MTKAELVEKIHAKAGLPTKAKAEEALDAVVASLREALASGESVTFTGFGSFKVVERAARKGRNPRTALDVAHHGDTRSFNLLAGKLSVLHGLQTNVAKGNSRTACGQAAEAALLPFAEFYFFRRKHY